MILVNIVIGGFYADKILSVCLFDSIICPNEIFDR